MNSKHEEAIDEMDGRRPLKVRQAGFAGKAAKWLSEKQVTPNQISIASVGFAALAAICLVLLPLLSNPIEGGVSNCLLPLLAALFIQARLLCNLFDGMVAVEGGKGTPSGELFNDIPDRIADPLILIAAGYAVSSFGWASSLGWAAGVLAVMTAYVRTLSASIGAPVDFSGPMAKQHRMALMTVACVVAALQAWLWSADITFALALACIVIGCLFTIFRRTRNAYIFLEAQHETNEA